MLKQPSEDDISNVVSQVRVLILTQRFQDWGNRLVLLVGRVGEWHLVARDVSGVLEPTALCAKM